MTFYAGTYCIRPELQVRTRLVAFFENGLMDSVGHDRGLFGKFRELLFDTIGAAVRLKA